MYPSYGNRDPGLGIDPVTVATTAFDIGRRIFGGGRPRAGGPDPCGYCEGRETFAGVLVKNAGQGGAPPDFRNLPQCPDASVPCGGGIDVPGLGPVSRTANKDDALDCVPQPWGGKYWLLDPCTQMWVDVTPAAAVAPPTAPGAAPGVPPPPPPEAKNGIGKLLLPAAAAFLLLR